MSQLSLFPVSALHASANGEAGAHPPEPSWPVDDNDLPSDPAPSRLVGGHAAIWTANCLEVLPSLRTESVDMVLTDPPYGIGIDSWDNIGSGRAYTQWAAAWAVECARVLKPDGVLIAFSHVRSWHRLAMAFDTAGLTTHAPSAWCYPGGFPKSLDVARTIDLAHRGEDPRRARRSDPRQLSPAARSWAGWSSHLKPSWDPIVIATRGLYDLDVPPWVWSHRASASERPGRGAAHKSVKPLSVTSALLPGNRGVVLDPFAGSGTTIEAALDAGHRVLAIEQDPRYMPAIDARLTRTGLVA